jgi:hypothetical protein
MFPCAIWLDFACLVRLDRRVSSLFVRSSFAVPSLLARRVRKRCVRAASSVALLTVLASFEARAEDGATITAAQAPYPTAHQGPWVVLEQAHGITISKRDNASGLPGFRGRGRVHGNVLRILSLLLDVEAVPRWAYGVDDARMVKRPTERSDTVYLYSNVAWPVRDRDMIVRRKIEVLEPGKHFRIALTCAPDEVPERSGIVRVRECESHFELHADGAEHTVVDYAMTLDPAGLLPKWAGAWVAKHVPLRTLEAIEAEAAEPACAERYEAAIRRWSAAM